MYQCPSCQGETKVIDSRWATGRVRRRRECPQCNQRFSTYEIQADTLEVEQHELRTATEAAKAAQAKAQNVVNTIRADVLDVIRQDFADYYGRREALTLSEFSARLGIHPLTASRWIKKGKVPGAFMVGRVWRIPLASVENMEKGG